jgi:hypothetical protein
MNRICLFGPLLIAASLCSTPALALDGRVVGLGGSDTVFVWKSKDAQNQAYTLMEAGAHQSNPALVMRLLSCVVPSGTKAIITDMGFATHDIMIIEGEFSGCEGNIPMEAWD